MAFHEKSDSGVIIFHIDGEVDLFNSQALKKAILKHMEDGNNKIIIDLEKTRNIDSSGIATIIGLFSKLKKVAGGGLKIANVIQDPVREVFEISKLFSLFETYSSIDEAKKSFS